MIFNSNVRIKWRLKWLIYKYLLNWCFIFFVLKLLQFQCIVLWRPNKGFIVQCIKNPRKNHVGYSRLYSFFERHQFFFQQQFGFRKNHCTSHALSFLINNITESLANKTPNLGVFLDLSKAFDTTDHRILLSKLKHSGIRGIALDWIKSYLTGRRQKVEMLWDSFEVGQSRETRRTTEVKFNPTSFSYLC